ncbi:MAG: hypothetical protein JEZ09_18235 [Salinivirgaceae bacterium]|nr:hypothetical protein [Salinivirgaceae bacterium]
MKNNIISWSIAIAITAILCFFASYLIAFKVWYIPIVAIICTILVLVMKHFSKKKLSKA